MSHFGRRSRYCWHRSIGRLVLANIVKVVVAFTLTEALTLLASMVALYFDLIGDHLPEHERSVVDRLFRRFVALELDLPRRRFWSKVVERLILGFSDQQLVTGTAILLAAFIRLPTSNGQIRAYHFSVVTDLAWFSANTHLVTLFVLRDYFSTHIALRLWRTIGMLVMIALLVIASILSTNKYWYGNPDEFVDGHSVDFTGVNCPTICLIGDLKKNMGGSPLKWVIVDLLVLFWGYSIALARLYRPRNKIWKRITQTTRDYYLSVRSQRFEIRFCCSSFGTISRGIYDLMRSSVFITIFNSAWFGLGVLSMFADRSEGHRLLGQGENEDSWGFGQIMALLLMLLPCFAALEIFYGDLPEFQMHRLMKQNNVERHIQALSIVSSQP